MSEYYKCIFYIDKEPHMEIEDETQIINLNKGDKFVFKNMNYLVVDKFFELQESPLQFIERVYLEMYRDKNLKDLLD